jgi:hypothetical protein
MVETLVLAPGGFGAEAEEFVVRACAELRSCRRLIVGDTTSVESAFEGAAPRSLVIGSLSSDLAIGVAALAAQFDLVHLEVGALSERAVGRSSLRVTGGVAETARLATSAVAGRSWRVAAESSAFAQSLIDALGSVDLGSGTVTPIEEVCRDFPGYWGAGKPSDVLVVVARPPYPEVLCRAISQSAVRGVEILGLGSWGRRVVDNCAREAGVQLRFVDVLPASLLEPDALSEPVRASLLRYLPQRRSVYGDLGWAAGHLARTVLEGTKDDVYALSKRRLAVSEVGFGHGVAFDDHGRNRLAAKALLAWERGKLVRVAGFDMEDRDGGST